MESIYATDLDGGIAKNGTIPWHSTTDLKFFYKQTVNNVVVMGRNTYLSIPEEYRPLKKRLNIVLTRTPDAYPAEPNVLFVENLDMIKHKLHEHFPYLKPDYKVFIIGGKTLYDTYVPKSVVVWETIIKSRYDCDMFIKYDYSEFQSDTYFEDDELKIIKHTRLK